VTRIPVVVGFHLPAAFREAVHREERDGVEYVIEIGPAQVAGFGRLMNAMFTRSVAVTEPAAAAVTDPEIRGVLEPVLEDLSFVTPRDTGTPLYAVSLKYRINAYRPTASSWTPGRSPATARRPPARYPGRARDCCRRPRPSPCATRAPRSPSRCVSRRSCEG